jgi:hypothetical protein
MGIRWNKYTVTVTVTVTVAALKKQRIRRLQNDDQRQPPNHTNTADVIKAKRKLKMLSTYTLK